MSLPDEEPDAFRASVREAQVATGPRLLRPFAPLVGWFYEAIPPALRQFRGVIGVAIAIELAELGLHLYELFVLR